MQLVYLNCRIRLFVARAFQQCVIFPYLKLLTLSCLVMSAHIILDGRQQLQQLGLRLFVTAAMCISLYDNALAQVTIKTKN
jgi:hypothetical protein